MRRPRGNEGSSPQAGVEYRAILDQVQSLKEAVGHLAVELRLLDEHQRSFIRGLF